MSCEKNASVIRLFDIQLKYDYTPTNESATMKVSK